MKWMALFSVGGFGLFALVIGVVWGLRKHELFRSGLRTQGTVVDHYKSVSTSVGDPWNRTGPDVSYFPVVEFQTAAGAAIRFRGATGSGVPEYDTGALVTVAYQPDKPKEAQILNFSQFWLGPVVVIVAGLLFFLMGVGAFFLIGSSDRHLESAQDLIRRQFPTRPDAVFSQEPGGVIKFGPPKKGAAGDRLEDDAG